MSWYENFKTPSNSFLLVLERWENDRKEDNRTKAIVSNFFEKKKRKGERKRKMRRHTCTCFVKRRQKILLKRESKFLERTCNSQEWILLKEERNVVTRQCGVFVQRFRSCTADPRIRLDLQWKGFDETRKKKETGKRFLFLFAGMKQSYVNKFGVVTLLQIVQDRSIVEIS